MAKQNEFELVPVEFAPFRAATSGDLHPCAGCAFSIEYNFKVNTTRCEFSARGQRSAPGEQGRYHRPCVPNHVLRYRHIITGKFYEPDEIVDMYKEP